MHGNKSSVSFSTCVESKLLNGQLAEVIRETPMILLEESLISDVGLHYIYNAQISYCLLPRGQNTEEFYLFCSTSW